MSKSMSQFSEDMIKQMEDLHNRRDKARKELEKVEHEMTMWHIRMGAVLCKQVVK